jgi:ankyrin repeat protein
MMKRLILATTLGYGLCCAPAFAQALAELTEQQNFAAALELVQSGADVNQPTVDGTTALHWAAYFGNIELAARLLRAEADPNTRNDYGSSPLLEAATVGNVEMLKLLLDGGADVESANPEGQTALMAVARTGNLEAARLLLGHGADVNVAEAWGGQTALMWAAARQHPALVSLLIEQGATVDQRAIDRNWERRVTAEPRVKEMFTGGFTALLYAVREDCLDCVKRLLAAGADINKPDPDNVSPLILALLNMRYDIAKYLVEQGADVNQWDYWGRTPLYAAADLNILPASARGDLPPLQSTTALEVAGMLLERGAEPNYYLKLAPPPRNIVFDRAGDNGVMNTGSTPLQRAAYGADIDMMRLLLEHGADLSLANVNGVTPMIALSNPGGSRNRNKSEQTVMQGLALLMQAGADINQHGGINGETPLHTSARQNSLEVVKFLVAQGADLHAKDRNGLIPLDYATGKADTQSLGNFNVVGELPEMAALLQELMNAQN